MDIFSVRCGLQSHRRENGFKKREMVWVYVKRIYFNNIQIFTWDDQGSEYLWTYTTEFDGYIEKKIDVEQLVAIIFGL